MSSRSLILGLLAGVVAVSFIAVVHAGDSKSALPEPPPAAPDKTGKERLGDKASDEQRVDNCKVPPERRGPKPRPAAC